MLHLLYLFPQHFQQPVSGAEGLLSIGAIEFLSHLRQDVDPELHRSIDSVIRQLLSLPQDDAVDHDQQCLYKDHNPEMIKSIQISVNHIEKEQCYGGYQIQVMGAAPVFDSEILFVPCSWRGFSSFTTKLKMCFVVCYILIDINSFPGQRSATQREPNCPPVSLNTQLSPPQNGLHPSTHSVSVSSSPNPTAGYFNEQGGQYSTPNSVTPLQVNSLHGAESLSSKQH